MKNNIVSVQTQENLINSFKSVLLDQRTNMDESISFEVEFEDSRFVFFDFEKDGSITVTCSKGIKIQDG